MALPSPALRLTEHIGPSLSGINASSRLMDGEHDEIVAGEPSAKQLGRGASDSLSPSLDHGNHEPPANQGEVGSYVTAQGG